MYQSPEEAIAAELSPDEKLLWAGRPRLGLRLQASDALLIPFSVMWCGFAIFWEAGVIGAGAPWFFALWGVPFVAIGLFFVFGRFFVDARQRQTTFYAVTCDRVLIISGLFRRQVKSLGIDTLTDLSLSERGNGGGTISFGSVPFWYSFYGNAIWPGMQSHSVPQFDLASDARPVYEIIRSAQKDARQRR